jgi:hypothetical protein
MNLQINIIQKAFVRFLRRFHVTIFAIVILGGLAVIILLLYNVIIASGESGDYTPKTNTANFDETTIERIKQLRTTSEESEQLDLTGRINPFVE